MNKLIVYHGTAFLFENADLQKSKDKRDFGRGFYTTTLAAQAESWAKNIALRNRKTYGYVYAYELTLDAGLKVKEFSTLNLEWLDFIKINRTMGGIQHDYDIVIGPVADDNTMLTVNRYFTGVYDAAEALKRLAYYQANNQVSLHTEKAVGFLDLQRRYKVDC